MTAGFESGSVCSRRTPTRHPRRPSRGRDSTTDPLEPVKTGYDAMRLRVRSHVKLARAHNVVRFLMLTLVLAAIGVSGSGDGASVRLPGPQGGGVTLLPNGWRI